MKYSGSWFGVSHRVPVGDARSRVHKHPRKREYEEHEDEYPVYWFEPSNALTFKE